MSAMRCIAEYDLGLFQHVIDELSAVDLWGNQTLRQTYPGSAHHDTEAVYLRWAPEWTPHSIFETVDSVDQPEITLVPYTFCLARKLLVEVLRVPSVYEIGRVMAVRLKSGGHIEPHSDEGVYSDHFDRFHFVLTSEPGNLFRVGRDHAHMRPGQLWWFNHKEEHEVWNHSDAPRIHLIMDAVVPYYRAWREPRKALAKSVWE